MSTNSGGPVFTGKARVEYGGGRWDMEDLGGMTLRQYYAAKAMQGEMSRTEVPIASIKECVAYYFAIADAMITYEGK